MASNLLKPIFHVREASKEHTPKSLPKDATNNVDQGNSAPPSNVELDSMPIGSGALYSGPQQPPRVIQPPPKHSTAESPNEDDVEMSRPPSPDTTTSATNPTQALLSWNNPPMNRFRILSVSLVFLAQGMQDAVSGALLPYIEAYYHVNYAIVSLIFVANALGFISAAFAVHAMDAQLGRAKMFVVNEALLVAGYVAIGATSPYWLFVVAFFTNGFGIATMLALDNVFGANLANPSVVLGLFHGCYGIGGTIAPIIATAMVSNGILFSRFYLITLGIRVVNLIFNWYTFRDFEKDGSAATISQEGANVQKASKLQQLKRSLKNRTTLIGAFFIFAYQGAEVSISGWVVSFLITYRHGDPKNVGYVTAGFWGGITLGRFTLSHVASRIGEKRAVYVLVAGTLGLQFLFWFVPNIIGDSVAVALIGLLLGPVYPCATTIFSRLLPRSLQNTAIAFISSAGSSGGAVAPFLTGLLAQSYGTWVLNPVCIAMYAVMQICWWSLPPVGRKKE